MRSSDGRGIVYKHPGTICYRLTWWASPFRSCCRNRFQCVPNTRDCLSERRIQRLAHHSFKTMKRFPSSSKTSTSALPHSRWLRANSRASSVVRNCHSFFSVCRRHPAFSKNWSRYLACIPLFRSPVREWIAGFFDVHLVMASQGCPRSGRKERRKAPASQGGRENPNWKLNCNSECGLMNASENPCPKIP